MPVTELDRNDHNSKPVCHCRPPTNVSRARKEISAIRDFFTECSKRPYKQQSKQRHWSVAGDFICQLRRTRRRPEKSSHRFDDELPKEDADTSGDQCDQEDSPPRCRAPEAH